MTQAIPTPDGYVTAYGEGRIARYAGIARQDNPHAGKGRPRHRRGWLSGWDDADERAAFAMARRAALEGIAI